MNPRHIQTFLTASAAFFALSAPLSSNACTTSTHTQGSTQRSAAPLSGTAGSQSGNGASRS